MSRDKRAINDRLGVKTADQRFVRGLRTDFELSLGECRRILELVKEVFSGNGQVLGVGKTR